MTQTDRTEATYFSAKQKAGVTGETYVYTHGQEEPMNKKELIEGTPDNKALCS